MANSCASRPATTMRACGLLVKTAPVSIYRRVAAGHPCDRGAATASPGVPASEQGEKAWLGLARLGIRRLSQEIQGELNQSWHFEAM